jgi:hypothetical protein
VSNEQQHGQEMVLKIEEVIAFMATSVDASDASTETQTRFHYLGSEVMERHGRDGLLAWAMIVYGATHAAYYDGQLGVDKFREIQVMLEPLVRELLDAPKLGH